MADYEIADRRDTEQLRKFLAQDGQLLLPILELVERAEIALDEVIDVAGRATIEAMLTLSARQLAGEKHPGKAAGEVRWHGRQPGVVHLSDRKIRVSRPRLRRKGAGAGAEVEIPAYAAMRSGGIAARMLEILMLGVSTRRYEKVLPEMAETVGVSNSAVSREFIEASEAKLRELAERRFDDLDIVVVFLDGLVFGSHHVLAAVGVDAEGNKHVLGLREGASENATVMMPRARMNVRGNRSSLIWKFWTARCVWAP